MWGNTQKGLIYIKSFYKPINRPVQNTQLKERCGRGNGVVRDEQKGEEDWKEEMVKEGGNRVKESREISRIFTLLASSIAKENGKRALSDTIGKRTAFGRVFDKNQKVYYIHCVSGSVSYRNN